MATYVNEKTAAFKRRGDPTDVPCKQRSDGRMKCYTSATDARAWVSNITENKQYIIDLMGCETQSTIPSTQHQANQMGKYVPVDVLMKTLMANKDADIRRLRNIIKDLEGFVSGLDLTCEERCNYFHMKSKWGAGNPQDYSETTQTRTSSESRVRQHHGRSGTSTPRTSSESRLTTPRSESERRTPRSARKTTRTPDHHSLHGGSTLCSSCRTMADSEKHINIVQMESSHKDVQVGGCASAKDCAVQCDNLTARTASASRIPVAKVDSKMAKKVPTGEDCECATNKAIAQKAIEQLEALKDIMNQRDELLEKLSSSQTEVDQLKAQVSRSESCSKDIAAMAAEIERLKSSGHTEELNVVSAELQLLKKYCQRLSGIKDENEGLKQEIAALRCACKSSKEKLTAHYSPVVSVGSSSNTSLAEDDLRKRLQAKVANLKEVTKQRDRLQSSVTKLEAKLQKYATLSNDLKEFKERTQVLDAIVEEKLNLERRLDRVQNLERDLIAMKQRAERADELQRALDDAQNRLLAVNEQQNMALSNAVSTTAAQDCRRCAHLQRQVQQMTRDIELMRVERDRMRVRVGELQGADYECQALQQKCRTLEAISNERDMYKTKSAELQTVQQDCYNLREQADQVNMLAAERDALMRKICDLECIIADQENEISRLVMHIDRLSRGQDRHQDKTKEIIKDLRSEIDHKNSLIAHSEEQLAAVQGQLKQTIDKLTDETTSLKGEVVRAQNKTKALCQCLEDTKMNLDKERMICRCYKDEVATLNKENARLQDMAEKANELTDNDKLEKILRKSHEALQTAAEKLTAYSESTKKPPSATASTNTLPLDTTEVGTHLKAGTLQEVQDTAMEAQPSAVGDSTQVSKVHMKEGEPIGVNATPSIDIAETETEVRTETLVNEAVSTAATVVTDMGSAAYGPSVHDAQVEPHTETNVVDGRMGGAAVLMQPSGSAPRTGVQGDSFCQTECFPCVHSVHTPTSSMIMQQTAGTSGPMSLVGAKRSQPMQKEGEEARFAQGRDPLLPSCICTSSKTNMENIIELERKGRIDLSNIQCVCKGVQHEKCQCVNSGTDPPCRTDLAPSAKCVSSTQTLRDIEKLEAAGVNLDKVQCVCKGVQNERCVCKTTGVQSQPHPRRNDPKLGICFSSPETRARIEELDRQGLINLDRVRCICRGVQHEVCQCKSTSTYPIPSAKTSTSGIYSDVDDCVCDKDTGSLKDEQTKKEQHMNDMKKQYDSVLMENEALKKRSSEIQEIAKKQISDLSLELKKTRETDDSKVAQELRDQNKALLKELDKLQKLKCECISRETQTKPVEGYSSALPPGTAGTPSDGHRPDGASGLPSNIPGQINAMGPSAVGPGVTPSVVQGPMQDARSYKEPEIAGVGASGTHPSQIVPGDQREEITKPISQLPSQITPTGAISGAKDDGKPADYNNLLDELENLRKQLAQCKEENAAAKEGPVRDGAPPAGPPPPGAPSQAEALNKLQQCTDELDELRRQLANCKKDLEEQKKMTAAGATSAPGAIPADHSAANDDLRKQLEAPKKELAQSADIVKAPDSSSELDDLRKQLEALRKQLEESNKRLEDCQKHLEEEKKKLEEERKKVSGAAGPADTSELDALRKQLAEARKQLESKPAAAAAGPTGASAPAASAGAPRDNRDSELDELRKQLAKCREQLESKQSGTVAPGAGAAAPKPGSTGPGPVATGGGVKAPATVGGPATSTPAGAADPGAATSAAAVGQASKPPAAATGPGAATPAAAAGPASKTPAAAAGPGAATPAATAGPASKTPAAAGGPGAATPAAAAGPASKAPAGTAGPAGSTPPGASGPGSTIPAGATGPATFTPAGAAGPVASTPAGATGPATSTPAGAAGPGSTIPAGATGPATSTPAGAAGPVASTPAGATGPAISTPAGAAGPGSTIPAGATGPATSTPAGAAGPVASTPAGATGPATSTPAGAAGPASKPPAGTAGPGATTPAGVKGPAASTPAVGGASQGVISPAPGAGATTPASAAGAEVASKEEPVGAAATGAAADQSSGQAPTGAAATDETLKAQTSKIASLQKELQDIKRQSSEALKATKESYHRDIKNLQEKYVDGIEKLQASHEEIVAEGHKVLEAEIDSLRKESVKKDETIEDLRCLCYTKIKKKPVLCQVNVQSCDIQMECVVEDMQFAYLLRKTLYCGLETLTFEDLQYLHTFICDAIAKIMQTGRLNGDEVILPCSGHRQRQTQAQSQIATLQMEVSLERQRLESLKKALEIERCVRQTIAQQYEQNAKYSYMSRIPTSRTEPSLCHHITLESMNQTTNASSPHAQSKALASTRVENPCFVPPDMTHTEITTSCCNSNACPSGDAALFRSTSLKKPARNKAA